MSQNWHNESAKGIHKTPHNIILYSHHVTSFPFLLSEQEGRFSGSLAVELTVRSAMHTMRCCSRRWGQSRWEQCFCRRMNCNDRPPVIRSDAQFMNNKTLLVSITSKSGPVMCRVVESNLAVGWVCVTETALYGTESLGLADLKHKRRVWTNWSDNKNIWGSVLQ